MSAAQRNLILVGDVSRLLPTGYPDGVRNIAGATAISVHVFGTDVTRVGSSARHYVG